MKKIKFKIEYVPLSDARIERHKDFDGLMAAFAAHPKPTFKERLKAKLSGNKFLVYMGGIITGAVITSLMWWGVSHYNGNEKMAKNESTSKKEVVAPTINNQSDNGNSSAEKKQTDLNSIENHNEVSAQEKNATPATSNGQFEESKSNSSIASAESSAKATPSDKTSNRETAIVQNQKSDGSESVAKNSSSFSQKTSSQKEEGKKSDGIQKNSKSPGVNSGKNAGAAGGIINQSNKNNGGASSGGANASNNSFGAGSEQITYLNESRIDTLHLKYEPLPLKIRRPSLSLANEDSAKKKFHLNLPKIDVGEEWNSTKVAVSKLADTVGNKTGGFLSKLFSKDSLKKEKETISKYADTSSHQNSQASGDTFKHRFGQVSFVTPLATDGVNGVEYEHNLSLNILQGYNGALNGAEFGGLVNVEKGYVKGGQFGGLVNFAVGDVRGAQFAGLVNNGNNVHGFQAAGIVNIATGTMTGMQAGGIANFARDTMSGLQLGGIVNLSLANKPSKSSWQIAGISNVSLGNTSGGQISGIANIANEQHGIQMGLINVSKKISGFQLGLINVADTIDGESLGLINISRNGIHHIDVFGSEVLFANAGLKLGSPHVYTELAYGIRPYSDIVRMGFGAAVGGHIPFNHGFVDIDGMCWTIHNDNLRDWNNINLWNQIRFMAGYQISKGVSIYAGPTLNLQVYDLSYPSIAPYIIYEHTSGTTKLEGWIGGTIGFQFF